MRDNHVNIVRNKKTKLKGEDNHYSIDENEQNEEDQNEIDF